MHLSRLVLNGPVFFKMSILDLSIHLMYDLYYNQLRRQYGGHCQLLFTDTDILLLEIETEDVNKNMAQNQGIYDASDYPQDHPLNSAANLNVLGKLKNERAGQAIAEYVGLHPKMYSIHKASGDSIKKAKGVKRPS